MKSYDEIISLGSNCSPGLSLRQLNLKKETYPFDWVRSNSKIIYDVLLHGKNNYINFDTINNTNSKYYVNDLHNNTHPNFISSHINYYGQHFTHYTNISKTELIFKFDTYLNRFFKVLNSNKTILFIHSNEEYIYHKQSRDNKIELFNYLCKINDILKTKYPTLNFTIINIDANNNFENYKNIINLNIKYKFPLSNKCENHKPHFYNSYRNAITTKINQYLNT